MYPSQQLVNRNKEENSVINYLVDLSLFLGKKLSWLILFGCL